MTSIQFADHNHILYHENERHGTSDDLFYK